MERDGGRGQRRNAPARKWLPRRWQLGGVATLALASIGGAVFAQGTALTYLTWGGYDDPSFRKPYTDKYGDGPNFSFYGGTDEAFAKLQAGFQADVAHPCVHDVQKWKDAGLLQPIDTAKVTSWSDLLPALKDAPALTLDGQQWLVPWEWGASSVLYRTDKYDAAEQSFQVMIDPKFKGKTAFPDAFDEIFQLAAVLAGVEKPLELTEADYAKVEEKFRALRDNARFIWSDPAQLEQALASGEVEVAWGWPNSFKNLQAQDAPIGFMLEPKEKLVTWLCGFAHLKGATAPVDQVYDFINALEAPESGKALVENFGYGHANAKALEMVSKDVLAGLGLAGDPSEFLANGNLLGPMPADQRQRLIDMWENIKAGG